MNRVIAAENAKWTANAIEKSMNDPRLKELNICPICMVDLPVCHCVDRCIICNQRFGVCKCKGQFTSAFDKKTGKRLDPPKRIAPLAPVYSASAWTGR